MEKPTMPNIPGMSAMTDTLEFVKNLWGGMKVPGVGVPGMVMPSLSVEEINKQITDLKAVESWLTVNMNMLRATIQALEVQSATLTTLKAMGDNINTAMQNAAKEKPAAASATQREPEAKAEAKAEARRKTRTRLKEEFKTAKAAGEETPAAPKAGNGQTDFAAPLANPAVWWNLLQDQFKQAVGSAMATETGAAKAKTSTVSEESAATEGTGTAKRKPRSKTH